MRIAFSPETLKDNWRVPEGCDILAIGQAGKELPDIRVVRADHMKDISHDDHNRVPIIVDAVDQAPSPAQVREWFRMDCRDVILDAAERTLPEPAATESELFPGFIGDSAPMKSLFKRIQQVARTDATVLIRGESGTGKELVARSVHQMSKRSSGPFVAVNCAAIPETLLEDDLFGHVRGAFTDARENRLGKIQAANGGTLFLDEIGDMPPLLQVKLLRVLQEKEIQPLGTSETRQVDARVVAATAADLETMMKKGAFREDLFFRLNVIPLEIAPLRDRGKDLHILTSCFLERLASRHGLKPSPMTDEAMAIMAKHHWPGNIRELEHFLERLVIMREESGPIRAAELPLPFNGDRS